MKVGIEVEGKDKGLKTLFLNAHEITSIAEECLLDICNKHMIEQIYISDLQNKINLFSEYFYNLSKEYIICFEVSFLEQPPPEHISIMLNLNRPDLFFLKETDQIKFDKDLFVKAIPIKDMIITTPEDFAKDVEIYE